jgi:hypothetical protein
MSSTLVWCPAVPPSSEGLSFEMKVRISRKLWDTDGSTGGDKAVLTEVDIPFLEGMQAAGPAPVQKDCSTLIEAIRKYGAVYLWHEH